ncbi:hypothetical protein Aargi30884_16490 [Amedibacterium intestinale]|uniref:SpoVT-AbrB domain-containing protein n=1 Tax=Amedibacterium intestinale TaxID=2583452 RepID=A0A6N4THQ9_9FIRM|nr:AbrB/MazE/SpoVT family DNA-binding domain-containing protein [Amedibacterium intestinale]BBK22746.1 hypothetical protein Aargi30884_16490 [Amedibacterium intestinale]
MDKKMYKKISKAGGITIPSIIRHSLNIPKGAAVELIADEEKLIIKKHIPTCECCGSAENVKVINQVELCHGCAMKFMKGGAGNGNDN